MTHRLLFLPVSAAALLSLGMSGAPQAAAPAAPPAAAPSAAAKRIEADVYYLASDKLKGRRAGTPEGDAAAKFMADSFRKAGLLPGGENGTYFQTFDFIDGVDLGPKNSLTTAVGAPVGETWKAGADFRPLGFSAAGEAEGEVVFAGYGISSKDPAWDDYVGLDVNGKVVLVLRYSPDGDDEKSPFLPYVSLRSKATTARAKGAKAVLFCTGPRTKGVKDDLAALRTDSSFSDAGIVAVSVKRAVAEALFSASGKTLDDAQKALDETRKPSSMPLARTRVSLVADITPRKAKTSNVCALLPGSDPTVNKQAVVVGAHYDHLGMGASGSLDPQPEGKIHPGADDNASGAAAILELARSFAARRGEMRRSLLFVSFGAEELGTLGSLYFAKNPTIPMDNIVAMVNMDMVGRLRNGKLDVHGVGTSPVWKPLVAKANEPLSLKLSFHEGGFGPSDHTPFYTANRPVLFLFTGVHGEYHKPADRPETINFEGIATVDAFVSPILRSMLNADAPPAFTKVAGDVAPGPSRTRSGVWVGTIPDFSEEGKGFLISGVTPGSPAEKAGIRGGDRMVRFGEKEIRSIYDYTYALNDHKPGEKVIVVLERTEGGKTGRVSIEVTLGFRPPKDR